MRISSGMGYNSFHTNLERLEEKNYFNLLRKETGKDIQCIADAPSRLMDVKKLFAQRNMKENYINVSEHAVSEMRQAEDFATAIADAMQQIRDLAVYSTNPAYDGTVSSVGEFIKGILSDMIRNSNGDFGGKYLFSGTKTTPYNIQADFPTMTNMPFEFVEGESTPDNFSGYYIVFKGNTDDRTINKDAHSNEVINLNAESMFGAGGIEFFQPIIDLYNVLQFMRDGTPRDSLDSMDREEKLVINDLQQQIAFNIDVLNKNIGIFASRRVRMETINIQMSEEVVRLKEVQSLKEDANMPRILSELAKEEAALQYSLSAGSQIQRYTLFNFL
jgi:flagellin-like hook-associated protein FlgL